MTLDCRSEVQYFGPLYAGAKQIEMQVIYDTMSKYTAIALQDADGQNTPSFYDIAESETAH